MVVEARVPVKYTWRPWKIFVLALAALLVAAGGVTALSGKSAKETPEATPDSAPQAAPSASGSIPGARGMFGSGTSPGTTVPSPLPAPGGSADGSAGESASDESMSPALLRGGLSFFVAFAVAFAFRTFVKIAMFFVGLWFASLFLLSSVGWIDIHWSAIDTTFTNWAGAVGRQFESFRTFIQGSLPSAGMAGLGLLAGFRRR